MGAGPAYRLAMPAPHTHLLDVEIRLPGGGGPLELVMPSWTPGSYLMREFARNVQGFRADTAHGDPLRWTKTDKSTWRVEPSAGDVVVRYQVYANETSVRTSHLDASHAYVNGASVFLFARGREREEIELRIDAPDGWRTTTSLPRTAADTFRARDYDHLVDSPLEIGTHELLAWEQAGVPHRFAIWGRGNHDPERLVADTRRIVAAASAMFGSLPYPEYTFILHLLPGGGGGLEHHDSTSLQMGRWAFRGEEYERFLGLVAHEFFHVWNGKRIRPEPLGPFDYTAENYTRNLWVVEGITTYYTDLLLRRAGLITPRRYLDRLGQAIERLQRLPGRHHQSLTESSFDAWIRFYRPDAHTPNAQISYYQKGALVALLLDMEIRGATAGARSLDDLMRLLWERFGQHGRGFPEDPRTGIQALAEEVAGKPLDEFFAAYVHGTEELDFEGALRVVGLQPRCTSASPAGGTGREPQAPPLGLELREEAGRARVASVLAGSPAYDAGVNAGDELVALDGLRLGPGELPDRLQGRRSGEEAALTVFRRDELLTLNVRLAAADPRHIILTARDDASPEQRRAFESWLAAYAAAAPEEAPPALDGGGGAGYISGSSKHML